jgi:hypothetical protein
VLKSVHSLEKINFSHFGHDLRLIDYTETNELKQEKAQWINPPGTHASNPLIFQRKTIQHGAQNVYEYAWWSRYVFLNLGNYQEPVRV